MANEPGGPDAQRARLRAINVEDVGCGDAQRRGCAKTREREHV
jgi:hypothetical protein